MAKKSSTSRDDFAISGMKLVAQTASIELTLNLIIWKLLDVPPGYGRPISARLTIWPKFEIIVSLLDRRKRQREQFVRYKKRLEGFYDIRNQIVHGGLWIHGEDTAKIHLADVRVRRDNPYVIAINEVSLKDIQKSAEKAGKLSIDLARFCAHMRPLPRKPREHSPKKKSGAPSSSLRNNTKVN